MIDTSMPDPYSYEELPDKNLWIKLLCLARDKNQELYEILFYLRGSGTKLVINLKFKYVLKPIICDAKRMGWSDVEQYKKESAALIPYRDLLVELLKEL